MDPVKVTRTISVDAETYEKFDQLCHRLGRTKSGEIGRMIRGFIEENGV